MAERYTAINGQQIKAAVAGDGLQKDASQNFAIDVSDFAGTGLEDDGSENLKIKLDGSTLAVGAGGLKVSAIANAEVAADAAIDLNKIVDMADTKVMIGSGAGNAEHALSGDITMTNAGVTAIGAIKVVDAMINDDVATGLAGVGIVASGGVLAVDLDEVTEVAMVVANDYITFLDASDSGDTKKEKWADLVALIAGTGITATNGVLSADFNTDTVVLEADVVCNEIPSGAIDDANTDYVLANTPETGTVEVYLSGMLQSPGSGKDYLISGTTITFADAPETNSRVLAHYIKSS